MTEQFTPIELCKRLATTIESYHWIWVIDNGNAAVWCHSVWNDSVHDDYEIVPAFTLGELVEWCRGKDLEVIMGRRKGESWKVTLHTSEHIAFVQFDPNPCVALAEAILAITEKER